MADTSRVPIGSWTVCIAHARELFVNELHARITGCAK